MLCFWKSVPLAGVDPDGHWCSRGEEGEAREETVDSFMWGSPGSCWERTFPFLEYFWNRVYCLSLFFFNVYLFLRETDRQRKWGRGRKRRRYRIGRRSRLQFVSTEIGRAHV